MRRCFGWKSAEAVPLGKRSRRGIAATVTLATLLGGFYPLVAQASADDAQRVALDMINKQSCAQRSSSGDGPDMVAQATAAPESPAPQSPAPVSTPGLPQVPPGVGNGTYQLNPTPRPFPGQTPSVTPPPIPRGTPNPTPSYAPIFLVRGGADAAAHSSGRAGDADAESRPSGAPTLAPGYVAVISDKWTGNRARGQPSDAIGNVHVFYGDEEIVGEHAHFDGERTITMTGHPFLVNHEHKDVLTADVITFDTVSETAKLTNGQGASDEGVQRGLVHFSR